MSENCSDPNKPEVNEDALECCDLTGANCVVTSEYQNFFKVGKGRTLTHLINVIAKFVKKDRSRILELESQVETFIPPYKVYTALLQQVGTGIPTVITVGENTLGINPTFARTDAGIYTITSTGSFPEGKTRIFGTDRTSASSLGTISNHHVIRYGQGDVDQMYINTFNNNSSDIGYNNLEDSVLDGGDTWVEIRVYN
jgi:hypothetical protein